jgi:hypothetical protein
MGPRKKSKQNTKPKDDSKDGPPPPAPDQATNAASSASPTPPVDVPSYPKTSSESKTSLSSSVGQVVKNQIQNRASWYGSWRGKAQPTAEVAHESIQASPRPDPVSPPPAVKMDKPATPSASGMSASPRRYLSGSSAQSLRSVPLAASMTTLNITSSGKVEGKPETTPEGGSQSQNTDPVSVPEAPMPPIASFAKLPVPSKNDPAGTKHTTPASSSGWFGWWSRPDGYVEKKKDPLEVEQSLIDEAKNKPLPGTTPLDTPDQSKILGEIDKTPTQEVSTVSTPPDGEEELKKQAEDGRSWFWLWSRSQNSRTGVLAKPALKEEQPKVDGDSVLPTPMEVDSKPTEASAKVNTDVKDGTASIREGKESGNRKATGFGLVTQRRRHPQMDLYISRLASLR